MKILFEKTAVKLEYPICPGELKHPGDDYYTMERKKDLEKGTIVWYGYNTNWKHEDGQWAVLENGDFIPCDVPKCEVLYQKLYRGEKIDNLLKE